MKTLFYLTLATIAMHTENNIVMVTIFIFLSLTIYKMIKYENTLEKTK